MAESYGPGKRYSAYTSESTKASDRKKKKKGKRNSVLGAVSSEAAKNMKDSEVGFSIRGIDKKKYLDSL